MLLMNLSHKCFKAGCLAIVNGHQRSCHLRNCSILAILAAFANRFHQLVNRTTGVVAGMVYLDVFALVVLFSFSAFHRELSFLLGRRRCFKLDELVFTVEATVFILQTM